jgi:hypothetical protein
MSAVTTPTLTPVASGASVLTATPAYVQSVFGPNSVSSADLGSSPANIYVVMGVGAYCTIVGDPNVGIAEAPVRGSPSDNSDPSKTYGRFAVVYKVSNTGGTASLVGCACPGGMGLMSSDGMEQKYYSTVHQ